jgi:hypothetical protein
VLDFYFLLGDMLDQCFGFIWGYGNSSILIVMYTESESLKNVDMSIVKLGRGLELNA